MAGKTYDLEGVVTNIGEELVFAEGRFKKVEFVVTVKSSYQDKVYEDPVVLECQNDSIYQLTGIQAGFKVKVLFVIQGRAAKGEFVGRYFNTLKAIKIDVLEATTTEQRATDTAQTSEQGAINSFVGEENPSLNPKDAPDDLPF